MFFAFYTNQDELYIWMYLIGGTPILSFVLLLFAVFRLKYTESVTEMKVVRGDKINYNLSILNEDVFLYPYVQTNFFVDSHINRELFSTGFFFLYPKKKYVVDKEILCKHTGGFNIGIKDFELRDYFGFFSLRSPNKTSIKYIFVLPKVHYPAKFASVQGNIEERINVSSNKGMLEDYTEIESIDEYQAGVPMKKVHWKASASKDKLMVKEFSHPNDISVCMYVDINIANYNDEDKLTAKDIVLESSLSIANYCVNKNITCKTMMNDIDMTDCTISTSSDFERYYQLMSGINLDKNLSFENMMRNYYNKNFTARDVIIVSGSITDYLMDLITELKMAGINVVLISPLLGSEEQKQRNIGCINTLRDKKITVYTMSSADEIENTLQS